MIELIEVALYLAFLFYGIWIAYDFGHDIGYEKGNRNGWKERDDWENTETISIMSGENDG